MSWKEKSEEIARAVMERHRRDLPADADTCRNAGSKPPDTLDADGVALMLAEAALEGIKWECECWCQRTR